MDLYLSIEAFVRVTESGSFGSAAQQLNVAKSVISTRVQQLEEHLGVSLFHRSSRAVKLSEIGLSYYGDCHDLMERMQALSQRSKNITAALTGTLRVAALNGFALQHLPAVIETFRKSHPHVEFDIFANDQVVDPVQEGFDLVLQIFPPASESLIERRLFRMRGVFVASPEYLRNIAPISSPDDLCVHDFACYRYYPWRNRWILHNGSQHEEVTLTPALRSNSVHLVNQFAHRAMGIAYLPTMIVWKDLLDGTLVRVLPEYRTEVPYFSAVYPTSHRATAKVKLFLDLLSATFAMEPEWDRALGLSEDVA
ncbi:LysR family transcriptional regulator [Burkholderia sp. SJ98]|uniref:LysR family transcriptional regulator n=1 Tax=Caballeronia sp. CLC5 TaxID=2906764 RepID=UPI00025BCB43|nr:LysR family transcriptional regulator [Caballeronia sp. CLC5]EKS70294.1 LysR family transcriptional regulator [Burkholderia sp. SJ98]MCE4573091.1 LysR family transcriptional regulator [Caballeronia sp. CLC5]